MVKPLTISEKNKVPGLQVYCYKCRTLVTNGICKFEQQKIPIAKCPHPEAQIFKAIVHVSGADNMRKTKALGRIPVTDAMKRTIEFSDAVNNKGGDNHRVSEQTGKPKTLLGLSGRYYGFLSGDESIVPSYMKEKESCSKSHLRDVNRTFSQLFVCLKKAGYPVTTMSVSDIDEKALSAFHDHIITELKLSNRSFNKALTILSSFYKHVKEFEKIEVDNIFKNIPHKPTHTNVEILPQNEYEKLLEIVQHPELGKCKMGKETKQLWRPYLKDFISVGLETGRRLEEVTMMTWDNIIHDEAGNIKCIRVEDYKTNRIKNRQGDQKKYIFVPITPSLHKLLMELGYDKYRGTNKHILAPEEPMKREGLKNLITRGFTQYYKQLNTGKDITFKSLRRTYISNLAASIGVENARSITKHSSLEIMEQSYFDPTVIASMAKNFKGAYGEDKQAEREKEIAQIRENKEKSITLER